MFARYSIQNTVLDCAPHASRQGLININVLDGSIVDVMLDGEVERGYLDCLAREPSHTLQAQDLVGVVAERLALRASLALPTYSPDTAHLNILAADVEDGHIGRDSHGGLVILLGCCG